jgi:small subunit ribosomal protein S15
MLTKRVKTATVKTVARHDKDTGSADVQVALLSRQIDELTKHLKKNKKDIHSRRGLLQMVADRRKHLRYLEKSDKKRYASVIKKLGLKK